MEKREFGIIKYPEPCSYVYTETKVLHDACDGRHDCYYDTHVIKAPAKQIHINSALMNLSGTSQTDNLEKCNITFMDFFFF